MMCDVALTNFGLLIKIDWSAIFSFVAEIAAHGVTTFDQQFWHRSLAFLVNCRIFVFVQPSELEKII